MLLKLKICSFHENETQEGWDVKIIKLCVYFCNVSFLNHTISCKFGDKTTIRIPNRLVSNVSFEKQLNWPSLIRIYQYGTVYRHIFLKMYLRLLTWITLLLNIFWNNRTKVATPNTEAFTFSWISTTFTQCLHGLHLSLCKNVRGSITIILFFLLLMIINFLAGY
jgi:hypothetical protein